MGLSENLAMIDEPAGLLAAADHGRVLAADQRGEDAAEQPFEVGRFEYDRAERVLPDHAVAQQPVVLRIVHERIIAPDRLWPHLRIPGRGRNRATGPNQPERGV